MRLDLRLSDQLQITRSSAQSLIRSGQVRVNDLIESLPRMEVQESDEIRVEQKDFSPMDLNIVHEDQDIAIINKRAGDVMHEGPGHKVSLTSALEAHFPCLSQVNVGQPGLVHRLDKDTSGLVIIAKNDEIHRILQMQIKDGQIKRKYMALVAGTPKDGVYEDWVGRAGRQKMRIAKSSDPFAKYAKMEVTVLARGPKYSRVECSLVTGIQHQIRCQMSARGCPVLGDPLYGRQRHERMHLCAYKLCFADGREFVIDPGW